MCFGYFCQAKLRVHEESQELLTIVTKMVRFTFKSLPQGISNSAALWNLLTDDVDARIDLKPRSLL